MLQHIWGANAIPDDHGLIAAYLSFLGAVAIVGLVLYVVNGIFQMRLLKAAGYKRPVAAWVPFWSTASLMETGGIRVAWGWVATTLAVNVLLQYMPPWLEVPMSLLLLVVLVLLWVYLAKGVHAGLGMRSTGGVVLAVLVPIAWVIWMSAVATRRVSEGRLYDRDAAIAAGGSLPMNVFGQGRPYEAFAKA